MLPDTSDLGGPDPAGNPLLSDCGGLPLAEDALAELYAWPERAGAAVVRANMITSLDGGTTVDGRSAGLGNPADERLFAVLRDLADVILVGSGTVRAEGYAGIAVDRERQARRRRWGLPAAPPPIAVVTARGLDPLSPLFTDTVTPPIVVTTRAAAARVPAGAAVVVAGAQDQVDLPAAIAGLSAMGLHRIHCEGGPSLLAALALAGLLDECCLTIAPLLLGSGASRLLPATPDAGLPWRLASARFDGDHLFTRYRRASGG